MDEKLLSNNKDLPTGVSAKCKCVTTSKTEFDLQGGRPSTTTSYDMDQPKQSAEAEFLRIHQKLGHISPHPKDGKAGDISSTTGYM